MNSVRVQGIYVGSRAMFERMNRAIEFHRIKPVVDRVFPWTEIKEALALHGEPAAFRQDLLEVLAARLFERRIIFARIGGEILKFRIAVQKREFHAAGGPLRCLARISSAMTFQAFFVRPINFFAEDEATISASCSIEPDSRRSLSMGR